MRTASFTVEISVLEPDVLAAFARTLDQEIESDAPVSELVEAALINPSEAPLDAGYELTKRVVRDVGLGRFVLSQEATIHDEAGFLAAVRSAYAKAWNEEFEPENLGHALYEIVLASNASPGPVEIGFEIVSQEYGGEPVAASQPAP